MRCRWRRWRRLQATRAEGNRAGLVVLATGLGKTWLSAFDTNRPEFKRVLFVAHREEILDQALATFRRIRPGAILGHYTGQTKEGNAEVLFASIQTLSRREHLERFAPDSFDYIIVDEFHHAAAASYRKLIAYFNPKFLLGLTATPERSDGGDLLALCQQNLVYRCDLVEGVRKELLSPFHYFGVPDEVDYANIPWRSTRFDEEALTTAVATQRRAENALEQFRKRGRHASAWVLRLDSGTPTSWRLSSDLEAFARWPSIPATTSAPRALSLEQLEQGDLDIVFAVDMFNEGVDLPTLDTVMMLRPTESKILWLQQFGRGLRRAPGKERLTVIDYIGNHRVFLLKPQTLFGLPPGDREVFNLLERLQNRHAGAAAWLRGDVRARGHRHPQVVAAPKRDAGRGAPAVLRGFPRRCTACARPRSRPTRTATTRGPFESDAGSWIAVRRVDGRPDRRAAARAGDCTEAFITSLDTTEMVKSYKMLVLLAMIERGAISRLNRDRRAGRQVERLATRTTRAACRYRRVAR